MHPWMIEMIEKIKEDQKAQIPLYQEELEPWKPPQKKEPPTPERGMVEIDTRI